MTKELWGTFSVKDHCQPRAFVADVMLYDRLVVPVPPKEPDDVREREWKRWEKNGWNPERQKRLLKVLEPLVCTVEWDSEQQEQWKERMVAAEKVSQQIPDYAFGASRTILTMDLPAYVEGVEALGVVYPSLEELEKELGVKGADGLAPLPASALATVLGREFLVLDDPRWPKDEDMLKAAVELACDSDFRRKRTALINWQQSFLKQGLTDRVSIEDAVKKMNELLNEEQKEVRKARGQKAVRYFFCIAPSALALLTLLAGEPSEAQMIGTVGGAFISPCAFTVDEWFSRSAKEGQISPEAFFHDARKHFGWK